MWSISANGEAVELLSWFHGAAKFLKLIPSPLADQNQKQDPFAHRRPLAAICDGASSAQFCSINFLSLRGGDVVSNMTNLCFLVTVMTHVTLIMFFPHLR